MDGDACTFETAQVELNGGETVSCSTTFSNPPLFGKAHTTKDCNDIGGTTKSAEGNLTCKLDVTSCPEGWNRYKNFGSTSGASKKCGKDRKGGSCFGGRCASISAITWADGATASNKSYGDDKCKVGCTCGGVKPNGLYYVYSSTTAVACY